MQYTKKVEDSLSSVNIEKTFEEKSDKEKATERVRSGSVKDTWLGKPLKQCTLPGGQINNTRRFSHGKY